MPSALDIGGLLIDTTKLAFVIFAFSSAWLVGFLARRARMDKVVLMRIAERSLVVGVIAARVAFAAEYPSAYRADPINILYFWQPGYELWAGLAGGAVFSAWRIMRSDARARHGIVFVGGMLPPLAAFLFVISTLNQFTPAGRLRAGMEAPALDLVDLGGKPTSLAALCGSPVVLNIWATWCYACRQEMPLLNRTYQKWKASGLKLIGVDLAEPASRVRLFLKQVPVSYPIWLDPQRQEASSSPTTALFERTGGAGLPTTIFIDKKGIVRSIGVGELVPATLVVELGRIGVRRPKPAANQVASARGCQGGQACLDCGNAIHTQALPE